MHIGSLQSEKAWKWCSSILTCDGLVRALSLHSLCQPLNGYLFQCSLFVNNNDDENDTNRQFIIKYADLDQVNESLCSVNSLVFSNNCIQTWRLSVIGIQSSKMNIEKGNYFLFSFLFPSIRISWICYWCQHILFQSKLSTEWSNCHQLWPRTYSCRKWIPQLYWIWDMASSCSNMWG